MAFANLAAYQAAVEGAGPEDIALNVAGVAVTNGRWTFAWVGNVPAGAAPTTAVAPTRTTTGALGQQNGGAGQLGVAGGTMIATQPGMAMLIDVLSFQGGMDATLTGARTTNLPTAALTRYTDGVGVMLAVVIWTQIGNTATTITCSYTNQANTAGRTSPLVVFGGTGFREAARLLPIPLQAGDTGVRSVQNSTISASTGNAGAFGYMLYKPLLCVPLAAPGQTIYPNLINGNFVGGLNEIVDNACLAWVMTANTTAQTGQGVLDLAEW